MKTRLSSMCRFVAIFCISLIFNWGGVKAQPYNPLNDCTFLETCNLVCNPSANHGSCNVGVFPDNETNLCIAFEGWASAYGTPDYFTGTPITFTTLAPIDMPCMLGFRSYGTYGDCGTNGANSEALLGVVDVRPETPRYIFSFFRAIAPNEPTVISNNGNQYPLQLEELIVFLCDNTTYPTLFDPQIGCIYWSSNNETADRFDLYHEYNINVEAWAQAVVCFDVTDGYAYDRIIILGREIAGNMYTLIDRIDIIADHFPTGTHNLTHDCQEVLVIGDDQTCGTIPNLTYQWQVSPDGISWTDIPGANQPTYQVPNIAQTTWYQLLRFMNTTNPVSSAPLVNPNMATCVADAAIYIVEPIGEACCMATTTDTYFAFNGSPHHTVSAAETWQPGSGNHPFSGYAGTTADPIRVNGTITIDPLAEVSMQNLNFEFGPDGQIVIEPTAAMDISGCTLTGDPVCQTMWQGIRVVGGGYDIAPDAAANAGKLHIRNSHILHALIGVANSRLPLFNLHDIAIITGDESVHPFVNFTSQVFQAIWYNSTFQSSGGIITTDQADFVNCFHGINLTWQSKPASTVIDNAIFQHNNTLSANGNLWYPFNTVSQSEAGIFILYYGHTTAITNSKFNSIKYGIRANVFNGLNILDNNFDICEIGVSARTFESPFITQSAIENNNFEDCYIGIQIDGGHTTRIISNHINRQNTNPLSYRWYNSDVTAGILLRATNFSVGGYIANKNYIDNVTFGILPINNIALGGIIENNQLINSVASVFALGNNKSVMIKCNDLHNYQLFGLGLAAWNTESGYLSQQGDCSANMPAGNSFIRGTTDEIFDLWRDLPNSDGFVYEDVNTDLPPPDLTLNPLPPDITVNECSSFNPQDLDDYCAGLFGIRSREEIIAYPDETKRNQEGARLLEEYLAAGDTVAALQLLQDINTKEAIRLLSSEYIASNQLTLAESILNILPRQTQEDEDFFRLQTILLELVSNEQEILDISSAQEATLLSIANNHTHTAYLAQSFLYAAKGHEFPIELPQIDGLQGSGYTAFKTGSNALVPYTLYPNPTTAEAYFKYQLPQNETAQFTLYEMNGNLKYSADMTGSGIYTLNTKSFRSGIYYYIVSINGKIVKRHKLVIVN